MLSFLYYSNQVLIECAVVVIVIIIIIIIIIVIIIVVVLSIEAYYNLIVSI